MDDTTIHYVRTRPFTPEGCRLDQAVAYWRTLHSDADAQFDTVVELMPPQIEPQVTWGTSPEMVLGDRRQRRNPPTSKTLVNVLPWSARCSTWRLEANKPLKRSVGRQGVHRLYAPTAASKICGSGCCRSVVKRSVAEWRATSKLGLVVPGSGLVEGTG